MAGLTGIGVGIAIGGRIDELVLNALHRDGLLGIGGGGLGLAVERVRGWVGVLACRAGKANLPIATSTSIAIAIAIATPDFDVDTDTDTDTDPDTDTDATPRSAHRTHGSWLKSQEPGRGGGDGVDRQGPVFQARVFQQQENSRRANMGRGDKRTRKSKVCRGSYGNTRPRKAKSLKLKKQRAKENA